ncbi:transcriptional regulator MntR [soil metagenome]
MATETNTESSAVEDYLEVILQLLDAKGYARVGDVAESLSISQASVSNMMRRLDEKGLLRHEKYRGVTLTSEGERVAKRIVRRHSMLEEFLELLGIEPKTAYADVEGMEHHISSGTLRGIAQIIEELKNDPSVRQRVRDAVRREP